MLEPLGKPALISAFVHAGHAGNIAIRRSHAGLLKCANNALVVDLIVPWRLKLKM